MQIFIDYQTENAPNSFYPKAEEIEKYYQTAAKILSISEDLELTVRIVENQEIQELNKTYRHKDYATNVLSFPADLDIPLIPKLLGDIIIAADVVNNEAREQNKSQENHWTHILIHGFLHLLGYDHIEDNEAEIMENLERQILAQMNISDPYLTREE
ncbi:MAG: rRNA maturation RNase YbeY [Cardiobacteriaceae bacterium]|nr:rRNA maturation RNase YbeY [Cardiobacteriaceae bacterium]